MAKPGCEPKASRGYHAGPYITAGPPARTGLQLGAALPQGGERAGVAKAANCAAVSTGPQNPSRAWVQPKTSSETGCPAGKRPASAGGWAIGLPELCAREGYLRAPST